ncbi:MAG TPA: glycosyl hydrolase family 39 [Terriglobia bacterium]|nr:glycosyl hydrolase family 39 [Terriglobia bacterium]
MCRRLRVVCSSFVLVLLFAAAGLGAADPPVKVQVQWGNVIRVSRTEPTLLLGSSPMTMRGTPLHDQILQRVKDLGANDVRYTGTGYLFPHMGIAELEPPTATSTSWDFSHIDPVVEDALGALAGHPVVLNFTTIPEWMFKTPKRVAYPADLTKVDWDYEQGKELRDPTYREVADYFARVVSWYVQGGFTDERGKRHESGHHYKVDYWEVFNEPDLEHQFSVETYTRLYDAVVEAIHRVSPQTKFVGISHSYIGAHPEYVTYFLNPKHHKPGIPLDMISYHFYAVPNADEPPEAQQFTYFDQADRFLEDVGYIEAIRKMLSPRTGTMVNEIGTMLPDDWAQTSPGYVFKPIRPDYWNLSAATFAYVFVGLARLGIDAAGESSIPNAPGMWPSIAMLDWDTAQPNARYWVLKLILDNFRPGDKLVESSSDSGYVTVQALVTPGGERKVLLINKREREFEVEPPEPAGANVEMIDLATGSNPPAAIPIAGSSFRLGGFGVAVVTLAK